MTVTTHNTDATPARSPDEGTSRTTRAPMRPSTIVWGACLLGFGILLIAIALGNRFSVFTLIIIALAGLGFAALLLAALPRPKPRIDVSNRGDEDLVEIFEPPAVEPDSAESDRDES